MRSRPRAVSSRPGASLIHMVDLDAAKDGSHANYGVVEQVIRETGATVELGGGIRSMQDVETVLALGVSRVIIGSAAVRHPEFVAEAVKSTATRSLSALMPRARLSARTAGWTTAAKITSRSLSAWSPTG